MKSNIEPHSLTLRGKQRVGHDGVGTLHSFLIISTIDKCWFEPSPSAFPLLLGPHGGHGGVGSLARSVRGTQQLSLGCSDAWKVFSLQDTNTGGLSAGKNH